MPPPYAAHNTASIDHAPNAGTPIDRSRPPIATIVISTRNRKDELARTLDSCMAQTGGAGWIETLVVDDASTDGTSELIAANYPAIRVVRQERADGLIEARNRGAREARGPIIFSIDDDAVFTSDDTVLRTVAAFENPRIGAVAMPHIHVTDSDRLYDMAPDDGHVYVNAAFTGTAHAIRREAFLALGSYHGQLIRQGEETDICLRLYDAGLVVALGRTPPIHHFPSTQRNYPRQLHYGARNAVLLNWIHCPARYLPARLLSNALGGLVNAVRLRHPRSFVGGVFAGFACMFRFRKLRKPVSPAAFRLFRLLTSKPGCRFEEIETLLPPLRTLAAPSTNLRRTAA